MSGNFLEVLRVFTRLGFFSFGGPTAHLGFYREEIVKRRGWVDERAFADLVGLCQSLPGPASSQVGFALGIGVVVYIEHSTTKITGLVKQLDQFSKTSAGLGRDLLDHHLGTMTGNQFDKFINLICSEFINPVDQNHVGLLELFLENVGGLWRETSRVATENTASVARLENDGIGGDLKTGVEESFDGLDHGGDQVGTTANRFGQDHVRSFILAQLLHRAHQLVKVAAETGAGPLSHGESL